LTEFHGNILSLSDNIAKKRFRGGGYFLTHTVYGWHKRPSDEARRNENRSMSKSC